MEKRVWMKGEKVPEIWVEFNNLEPGVSGPVDFTIGAKTLASIPEGKAYSLTVGKEYLLPVDLIDYLHDLAVPEFGWVVDPETQQLKSEQVGRKKRFSLSPTRLGSTDSVFTSEEKIRMEERIRIEVEAEAQAKYNKLMEERVAEAQAKMEADFRARMGEGGKPETLDEKRKRIKENG